MNPLMEHGSPSSTNPKGESIMAKYLSNMQDLGDWRKESGGGRAEGGGWIWAPRGEEIMLSNHDGWKERFRG